jgi:hypothetical protein
MQLRLILLLFCAIICLQSPVFGQVFMPQPSVGLSTGIGQAVVALPHTRFGIHQAAQLGFLEQKTTIYAGTALPYGLTDWNVASIDAAWKMDKKSGVALGLITNRVPQYSENAVSMSHGRLLSKKLAIGATIGYQFVQAGEYGSAGAPLVRISLIQKLLPELSLGASISNPGQQKLRNIPQNSVLQLGLHWATSEVFEVSGEVTKELKRSAIYRLGFAYSATQRFLVTGGLNSSSFAKAAIGFGIKIGPALRIDLAGSWHPVLGITPTAGVQVNMR